MPAASPPTDGPHPGSGKTCPSRACEVGVQLLGVMTAGGRLAYVSSPGPIDAEFVAQVKGQGHPESRFRFSGPCVEHSCPQWTGCGCAVADAVVDAGQFSPDDGLPPCGIRRTCRWFFQRGAAACAVCPAVVADVGGTRTHRFST